MKFNCSNKFDFCYYGQVNSLRLKSSVASEWARGNFYFAGDGTYKCFWCIGILWIQITYLFVLPLFTHQYKHCLQNIFSFVWCKQCESEFPVQALLPAIVCSAGVLVCLVCADNNVCLCEHNISAHNRPFLAFQVVKFPTNTQTRVCHFYSTGKVHVMLEKIFSSVH